MTDSYTLTVHDATGRHAATDILDDVDGPSTALVAAGWYLADRGWRAATADSNVDQRMVYVQLTAPACIGCIDPDGELAAHADAAWVDWTEQFLCVEHERQAEKDAVDNHRIARADDRNLL